MGETPSFPATAMQANLDIKDEPASTFSAGTLSPGSSMEFLEKDTTGNRWEGISSAKRGSWDNSAWGVCSPWTTRSDIVATYSLPGICLNQAKRNQDNDWADYSFTINHGDWNSVRRYSLDCGTNLELCDNTPRGYGTHTCADQNNRTFVRPHFLTPAIPWTSPDRNGN